MSNQTAGQPATETEAAAPMRAVPGTAKVTVRLFAAAREAAGADTIGLDLPAGATVADLRQALAECCPALRRLAPALLFAIGTCYASNPDRIPPGVELAAFPPVSGG